MKKNTYKTISGSGILLGAIMASNVFNFIFNAFLGRMISFADFSIVIVFNSLWYLFSVILTALYVTFNHRTAFLATEIHKRASIDFLQSSRKRILITASIATLGWLAITPLLASFFHISSLLTIAAFAPVIVLGVITAADRGFLQGNLFFISVAATFFIEALAKLFAAIGFVFFHQYSFAYLSIPITSVITCLFTIIITARKEEKIESRQTYSFPRRFFAAAVITSLSGTAFLTLDVIMAKHFLTSSLAGAYGILSLVGKMIYFFGSLFNSLMITFVSRDEGLHHSAQKTFNRLLAGNVLFVLLGFLFLGLLGGDIVPILFGQKTISILQYLPLYTLAISIFTISSAIVSYHLAKEHYSFPIVAIVMSCVMVSGIYFFHATIAAFTQVILIVSFINFLTIVFLHFVKDERKFIFAACIDFIGLLLPLPKRITVGKNKKKILIFNWRDTKHVFAGGAEVYIHELAKQWVKDGHYVTLFCGNDGSCLRSETIDGVHVIRRGGFYFVYLWAFLYYITKFRGKYQIIIDAQNGIPFFTPLYAREKVFSLLFHVHQDVFRKSLPGPIAWIASILENRVMPWIYAKTKFITISQSTKKDMQKWGIGKAGISVVYPGISAAILKYPKKANHPIILYVGRLKLYKSIDTLLKATRKIAKQIPQSEIIIAGDGEEKNRLMRLAKELKIDKQVTFLGKVDEDRKKDLYEKAWVFVNPSFMEGWGITTIEANAHGTPVVAADVPGLHESVKNPHTGFLVKHGDANAFAEKVIEIVSNQSLRQYMSKESLKWAKKFNWQKSAKQYLDVLQENKVDNPSEERIPAEHYYVFEEKAFL